MVLDHPNIDLWNGVRFEHCRRLLYRCQSIHSGTIILWNKAIYRINYHIKNHTVIRPLCIQNTVQFDDFET